MTDAAASGSIREMRTLRSTRFGELALADDEVLDFPAGLVGIGGRAYALVPHGEDSPFSWLHSLEDADLALPVCAPWAFFPDFELRMTGEDEELLGLAGDPVAAAEVLVTVRADGTGGFVANLAAPIVLVAGRGHQVLNQADAELRAPLLAAA